MATAAAAAEIASFVEQLSPQEEAALEAAVQSADFASIVGTVLEMERRYPGPWKQPAVPVEPIEQLKAG